MNSNSTLGGISTSLSTEPSTMSTESGFPDDSVRSDLSNVEVDPAISNKLDGDEESKIYLSAIYQNQLLGVAYFDEQLGSIHIGEVWEDEYFSLLRQLRFQIQPSVIILPSNSNNDLVEACKAPLEEGLPDVTVRVSKVGDYQYELSKRKLLLLQLPDMPKMMSVENQLLFLSSIIDVESTQAVRALGGLLSFLYREQIINQLEDEGSPLELNSLETIVFDNFMYISLESFKALQIFMSDAHPSKSGIGKAKEGISLLGILNKAKSVGGKKLMKLWFLRPLMDVGQICERLDTVEFLLDTLESHLLDELHDKMAFLYDVRRIIFNIKCVRMTVTDWKHLIESATSASQIHVDIKHILSVASTDLPVLLRIVNEFDPKLQELVTLLQSVIDMKESMKEGRIVIKDGVDQKLDELKQFYSGMGDFLVFLLPSLLKANTSPSKTNVAEKEIKKLNSDHIAALTVSYFPQLGYLIALPKESAISHEEIKNLKLEHQFSTDEYHYYKNDTMVNMDEEIGDVHSEIVDYESFLLRKLEGFVLECASTLLDLASSISELDCLISFAKCAREYSYTKPEITEDNVVFISEGKHPLYALEEGAFISNDTAMGQGRSGPVVVLTGPNASGKSVYLKQIALIAFMSQIGSFVPASACQIGVTDKIFTQILNVESISLRHSSFLISLKQVSAMIKSATPRSLLLIDEFGKATNASAVIKHLVERGVNCPKCLITTHYHEVFKEQELAEAENLYVFRCCEYPLLIPGRTFANMEFVVKKDDRDKENVFFLYKVTPGQCFSSFGIQCAISVGLPMELCERSREIIDAFSSGGTIERFDSGKSQEIINRYRILAKDFFDIVDDPRTIRHQLGEIISGSREE